MCEGLIQKKVVLLKGSLTGKLFQISISMGHLVRKDLRGETVKQREMLGLSSIA